MAIRQLLELSTIHIPETYIFEPNIYISGNETDAFIIVPTPQDDTPCWLEDDTPYWLYAIYLYAINQDATIVRFTPDAEIIVSLKQFTWS